MLSYDSAKNKESVGDNDAWGDSHIELDLSGPNATATATWTDNEKGHLYDGAAKVKCKLVKPLSLAEDLFESSSALVAPSGHYQIESRAMAQSRANRSAQDRGTSSAPWVGDTAFAVCSHDMGDEQTSARCFSHLPARSSVCSVSNRVVRRSQRRKRTSSLTTGALPLGFFGFFGFLTI